MHAQSVKHAKFALQQVAQSHWLFLWDSAIMAQSCSKTSTS
jgi:hypothetical protein